MEGFTKGPWAAVDKRPHSDGISIFSGEQYIAFVGDSDGVTNYKENANLIAAAPELLEALQEVVAAIKITLRGGHDRIIDLGGSCDSVDVMIKGHSEIARAEATITKALGQ